jgi:hypothetical protein
MTDEKTLQIINQFDAAFQTHDPSLLEGLLAEDCVLENSGPAPDGSRHVGRAACQDFWSGIAACGARHKFSGKPAAKPR